MNDERITEILEELKDSIDYPRIIVSSYDGSDDEEIDNDKCFTSSKCKVLLDYIEQLQNNWNELKKFVEEKMSDYEHKEASNFYVVFEKMQELEQDKDE